MSSSSIEWTEKTWNPTVGCTKISAGCKHCYAETMHARLTAMGQKKYAEPFRVVKPWPQHLAEPLRWKKPTRIFVNSMSDLFQEDLPDEYIAAVFGVMAACPQHTFQVLTKRAERMADWLGWASHLSADGFGTRAEIIERLWSFAGQYGLHRGRLPANPHHAGIDWPLPNVWLGVSVENQEQADARIPHLLRAPAAVRFLSCEPLLGHVDLAPWLFDPCDCMIPMQDGAGQHMPRCATFREPWGLDWVIIGGESGHGARPFDLEWARSIIAQCGTAGVPMFVKQMGQRPIWTVPPSGAPDDGGDLIELRLRHRKGGDPAEWPHDLRVREFPVSK